MVKSVSPRLDRPPPRWSKRTREKLRAGASYQCRTPSIPIPTARG